MMESNVLRQIEIGDVVFYSGNQYCKTNRKKYLDVFQDMVSAGMLRGSFSDTRWMGFSGVKCFGIDFTMDEVAYKSHIGKEFGITYSAMQDMLRCYTLYIVGAFIFPTINDKISCIKQFLTAYGEHTLKMPIDASETIRDFLLYINTPGPRIETILKRISFIGTKKTKARELSHLINYLVVANEINELYQMSLPDEEFKKWFPIYFWTNITFVIPLRATEMLVTPFRCIRRDGNKVYLKLRRTMLKGKKQTVYYQVEKDYKEFEYKVPDNIVVETIERYQKITSNHDRKYLFDHTQYMINDIMSLSSFNLLLADFINTYLIGNRKYDYARYATGITEFETITAGDSRPIAMANLYFQDVSADICRQLANHNHISTSYGYYTNVSNTIECASVMQVQRRINWERKEMNLEQEAYAIGVYCKTHTETESKCLSPLQPLVTGDIGDCVRENHLHECMGCRHYVPSEAELKRAFEERKQKLDNISKQLVEGVATVRTCEKNSIDIDKLFLDAQTGAFRFKVICDKRAEEAEYRWRRRISSPKKNC